MLHVGHGLGEFFKFKFGGNVSKTTKDFYVCCSESKSLLTMPLSVL